MSKEFAAGFSVVTQVRLRRVSPIASGRSDGPLSDHEAGGQPAQRELVVMPLKRLCRRDRGTARMGGKPAIV
jgi:hypothetical protein